MNLQTPISRQRQIGVCIIQIIHKIFDEDLDYVETNQQLAAKRDSP